MENQTETPFEIVGKMRYVNNIPHLIMKIPKSILDNSASLENDILIMFMRQITSPENTICFNIADSGDEIAIDLLPMSLNALEAQKPEEEDQGIGKFGGNDIEETK